MTFQNTKAFAQELDKQDPLHHYKNEFIFPQHNGKKCSVFYRKFSGTTTQKNQKIRR